MDVGIHVPVFDIDGGTTAIAGELGRVGPAVEASGANWLSFMDHFFQIEPTGLPAESNMLEGYTTLGYLAAHTSTVSLGLLVTGVTYRHPGVLAKTVTTLDVLSGGRAVLGIGAAWFEREHRGLGVPYPPLAERFERTLTLLAQNPAVPSLRTHKVNLAGVKVYSSSVTGDVRIIWRYADGVLDIIDLLDVGGHEGGNSVYR